MSFSSDVKQELCRIELADIKQRYSQCYGLLLFASKFSHREIVFKTENTHTANLFESLITELFTPIIEKQSTLKIKNTNSDKMRQQSNTANEGIIKNPRRTK